MNGSFPMAMLNNQRVFVIIYIYIYRYDEECLEWPWSNHWVTVVDQAENHRSKWVVFQQATTPEAFRFLDGPIARVFQNKNQP